MEYKLAELNLDRFHRSLVNLIRNAIDSEATAIAVRVNRQSHRMQIIDNGIGFSIDILKEIGENGFDNSFSRDYYLSYHKNYQDIIENNSAILIISTKSYTSHETYRKILKKGVIARITRILDRPTRGTTLTIYFLANIFMNNFSLSVLTNSIKYISKNFPQISFSIRDDVKKRMSLKIKKKYQRILKKKSYFSNFNIPLVFPSISCYRTPLNLEQNFVKESFSDFLNNNAIDNLKSPTIVDGMVPSQWSDWDLEPSNTDNNLRRYKFLPVKLSNLLPSNMKNKLISHKMSQEFKTGGMYNYFEKLPRRQDLDIRPCNKMKKLQRYEIRLDSETLNSLEIINQVNLEFIAAIVLQNGRKLLILIDQHAMHERIRYESLLKEYKFNNRLASIKLDRHIRLSGIPLNYLDLIINNIELFINFGLALTNDLITNTIIIKTIPKCFAKKKNNLLDLISLIRQLLMEIVEKLINGIGINNLPLVIHNMIASEACHGAIKFGDSLNYHQCNVMLNYWKETNLPNRCAHGRPVIIPLLFIDSK